MRKLTLFFFFVFSYTIVAQIQTSDEPYSLRNDIDNLSLLINRKIVTPNMSISDALAEDEIDSEYGTPPRFGLKIETNYNTNNSGIWTDLPNGDKLWRLRIKSPSAKSINLVYNAFHLPPGGMLHIYNNNKSHIIGGFTEINNKGTLENPGKFATGLVYKDEITLEYYHPTDVEQEAIISVSGVIHGYKYIRLLKQFHENEPDEVGFGDSGSCQVNINCTEGDNWQDEKKGVAMLLIDDGRRWCTGSLVNNTAQDGTLYFLTADHCLTEDGLDATGNTDASEWMFYWNYESPNCTNGPTEPIINSTTGATVRANNTNSDFALFELIESPVGAMYDVYFNGWDRTTNPTQGGVGIHHPAGDIKKIATHNLVPGPGQVQARFILLIRIGELIGPAQLTGSLLPRAGHQVLHYL